MCFESLVDLFYPAALQYANFNFALATSHINNLLVARFLMILICFGL